jgi:hypothetical protein
MATMAIIWFIVDKAGVSMTTVFNLLISSDTFRSGM